jgi:hypothetical protein
MVKRNIKIFAKAAPWVACTLAGCILAQAQGRDSEANPYSTIVARNIFGLKSLRVEQPPVTPVEPPPKILPDGFTTLFGRPQVLFKVVTLQNSPGAQTKQSFYDLAEGEEEDGVQVTHIDMTAGAVTFDNHGVIQNLPLANFSARGTDSKPPPTPAQILFNLSNRSQ